MKLIISGGHITPAIALIEYIQDKHRSVEMVFVGREYSQTSIAKQKSWEKIEIDKKNVPFITFDAPRLHKISAYNLLKIVFQFVHSFFIAFTIMLKQKPDVFVSFGSYQAVPLAIAAWCMRIPIVTHEQTRTLGLATKIIAPLARKIALSFPLQTSFGSKVVVTGNLIRRHLLDATLEVPSWLQKKSKKPLLYITGGNQGSEIINTVVGQTLPRLTKRWFVIHQCGNATSIRNYKTELEQLQAKLPASQKSSYVIKEWLSESELRIIYKQADVIISRAGANTLQEIQYYTVPSVLIPLPFSRNDEQLIGAESLSKKGAAYLLHQKDLNADTLIEALEVVKTQQKDMRLHLKKLPLILNSDEQLFDLIQAVAQQ